MAENVAMLLGYVTTRQFSSGDIDLTRDVIVGYGRLMATVDAWPPAMRTGRVPTTAEAFEFAESYGVIDADGETAGGGAA